MFKLKQKTKKFVSAGIIFTMLFLEIFPFRANAMDGVTAASFFGVPEAQIEKIKELYNKFVEKTDVDKYVEKYKNGTANGADNQIVAVTHKTDAPRVDVAFSGADLVGSSVTATAVPTFFKTDTKDLYFTWYLKRDGCDLGGDVTSRCDLDFNNKITVNDWKIAAAKIIVSGSSNLNEITEGGSSAVSYTGSIDEKAAGFKAASFSNCYVREPKSGFDYELQRVKEKISGCPSGTVMACASSDQQDTCDVLNPDYDEASYQAAPSSYSVPKTIKRTTNKFCGVTEDAGGVFCKITSDANLTNYKTKIACYNDQTPVCVKASGNTVYPSTTPYTSVIFGKGNLCSSLTLNPNSPAVTPPVPSWLNSQNSTFNGLEGQSCATAAVTAGAGGSCTFEKSDENMCEHLFAKPPSSVGSETGDGKFTMEEKKFWGADPSKSSTNGKGKDEENVVGLGMDSFTWTYSKGDKVGVVVEGDSSSPTEHADSTYKRTWAFSKNTCKALEDLSDLELASSSKYENNHNKRGIYIEGPGGQNCDPTDRSKCTGFLTAEMDLDQCLEENLLVPDAGDISKLSVQLDSEPKNPINDPNGKGDVLTITSTAVNTQNQSGVVYKWSVQKSMDGPSSPIDTTKWIDITKDMTDAQSFSADVLSGLDKKELAINLNMQDALITKSWEPSIVSEYNKKGVFYLRIKTEIIGGADDVGQEAKGFVVVKVSQQQNEMLVYAVTAGDDGLLSTNSSGGAAPVCNSQTEKLNCYKQKNEIVGVKIPTNSKSGSASFVWTVNNEPISCSSTTSAECADGHTLFFPILGNAGEAVDVTAKGLDKNNESISVSRHFIISQAGLQITSAEANSSCSAQCLDGVNLCPKFLGQYKDLDGIATPNCSSQVLEAKKGSTVTLGASGVGSGRGLEWTIDGQVMTEYQNQNQIQLTINKTEGENYSIGLSEYSLPVSDVQTGNIRKALYENWGVAPDSTVEENQSASTQLDVVASSAAVAKGDTGIFGASLITHLPQQLMFIFRITVTSILILLGTALLFAFIPETLFNEEVKKD